MKFLQLDFALAKKQRKRQQSNFVVVGLLLLIVVVMLIEQRRTDAQITKLEDTIATSQARPSARKAKPSQYDLQKMKEASVVQHHLNFPWHELLAVVEYVKQQVTQVKLMTIQPNPAKSEVLITAQAPNLKAMLRFVSLLEQQAILKDVLLINQRQLVLQDEVGLAFSMKMRWQI